MPVILYTLFSVLLHLLLNKTLKQRVRVRHWGKTWLQKPRPCYRLWLLPRAPPGNQEEPRWGLCGLSVRILLADCFEKGSQLWPEHDRVSGHLALMRLGANNKVWGTMAAELGSVTASLAARLGVRQAPLPELLLDMRVQINAGVQGGTRASGRCQMRV